MAYVREEDKAASLRFEVIAEVVGLSGKVIVLISLFYKIKLDFFFKLQKDIRISKIFEGNRFYDL